MKKLNKTSAKTLLVFGIIICLFAAGTVKSSAQTEPRVLLSWKAKSFAPAEFRGKVLPGPRSQVVVSLEIINGGKPVNLSGQTIYWYLNDQFAEGTQNKQTISFTAPNNAPDVVDVRVQLPDYAGGLLFSSARVPVAKPEVVIEAPAPEGNFSVPSLEVNALPYFFNVTSPLALTYAWNVNGETPKNAENPSTLVINVNPATPSGSTINVALTARDPNDLSYSAFANVGLTYLK